jgi:biotin carboxyl carrier protein
MKMELWVAAEASGRVTALRCRAGDPVASGALLVELALDAVE